MRSGTQDKKQPPGDGEKAPSKGEQAGVRHASPHGRRDKAPPTEHCHLFALPERSASANLRRVALEGSEQMKRSRRKSGAHTLKALHFLRRSCVAMPLSTRCLANSPSPLGGSVLSTSATFAQNLWTISQNSTDFAQNQWSFFCSCATWSKSLRSAGQK